MQHLTSSAVAILLILCAGRVGVRVLASQDCPREVSVEEYAAQSFDLTLDTRTWEEYIGGGDEECNAGSDPQKCDYGHVPGAAFLRNSARADGAVVYLDPATGDYIADPAVVEALAACPRVRGAAAVALLCRTGHRSGVLQAALAAAGVPCERLVNVKGGTKGFHDAPSLPPTVQGEGTVLDPFLAEHCPAVDSAEAPSSPAPSAASPGPAPSAGKLDCSTLDEASCAAEKDKCRLIRGAPGHVYCQQEDIEGRKKFAGCLNKDISCLDVLTWSSNPETEEIMVFPSSCVPKGWERIGRMSEEQLCDVIEQGLSLLTDLLAPKDGAPPAEEGSDADAPSPTAPAPADDAYARSDMDSKAAHSSTLTLMALAACHVANQLVLGQD